MNCAPINLPQEAAAIPLVRIAQSFGRAAQRYDRHAALQRDIADVLLHQQIPVQPGVIADLGCGTGYCAARLRAQHPHAQIVALDLAPPMLRATAGQAAVNLLCADIQRLPFAPESIDRIVSNLTLQWCASPGRAFAELFRVLRSGGQALISTFGPDTLRELRAAWSAVDTRDHVNRFVAAEALERLAREQGFSVRMVRETRTLHYPSLRALAHDLKGIGAHNMNTNRACGLGGRLALARAEKAFAQGADSVHGIPVTWEVLYFDLGKPGPDASGS